MKSTNTKIAKRQRRRTRIRAKISGTKEMPRLAVYKSLKYIYAQIINDEKGETLFSISTMTGTNSTGGNKVKNKKHNKTDAARAAGVDLATKAKEKGIIKVVFDRGGFIYTGRVKALAEGAREGGLEF
jgi:large subunit ribosomal protein L18